MRQLPLKHSFDHVVKNCCLKDFPLFFIMEIKCLTNEVFIKYSKKAMRTEGTWNEVELLRKTY